uniref:DDHD domain-containing protein n=1 Tax=Parascaris univalens TaxID=6257 RepID=A0A915AY74_PARUN
MSDDVNSACEITEDMQLNVDSDIGSEEKKDADEGCRTPLAEQISQPNFSNLLPNETAKLQRALSANTVSATTIITDNSKRIGDNGTSKFAVLTNEGGDAETKNENEVEADQQRSDRSCHPSEMQKSASMPENSKALRDKTPPVPPRSKKRRVVELKCSEVRWFYRRKGVETKWTPFRGCDSMLLEVYWRSRKDIDLDAATNAHICSVNNHVNTKSPVVLDGLYYVSETITSIYSIYWKDDEMEIRRGTWFLAESLQPINAEMADPIEAHHLHIFRSQMIPDTPVFSEKESSKKPLLTELKLQDQYEVRWNSVIDITLYNNSKTSRLLRYITWGKGTPLKRGYEEATWDDGKRIISHLILVVHGIGQKGYENLIAKNSEQVRDAMYTCMDRHYPEEKSRPMVLPVEWRANLLLDGGQTDFVTLPKMSTMRHALNSTAMDIMYYQSPLYRNEIMSGLARSMNTVYKLFMDNHPEFDGPISIFAHSLGSVMCYDLLTNWSPLVLFDEYVAEAINDHLRTSNNEDVAVLHSFQNARQKLLDLYGGFQKAFLNPNEQLNFRVTNLFCIGSPLAVFLIMRGAPTVYTAADRLKRIYNVFHPYDPVAYRLEPLVHHNYRFIRPIKLFSSIDLRALKDYDLLPPELHRSYIKKLKTREKREKDKEVKEVISEKERDDIDEEDECDSDESSALRPNSSCSSPRSLTPPPSEGAIAEPRKSWWKFGNTRKEKDATMEIGKEIDESKLTDAEKIIDDIPPEDRLLFRMDYQVQPQITERSYWSVLKSHFTYWTNADLATFVVNRLYSKEEKSADSGDS